jgi:hypothetical protein
LPTERENELREAAAQRGITVEIIAIERLSGGQFFDGSEFDNLLSSDPMAALDYILTHTPDYRVMAGLLTLMMSTSADLFTTRISGACHNQHKF